MRKAAPKALAESDEMYPPFPGFQTKAFTFLKDIKKNNVREWLTPERKQVYQDQLVQPMRLLLAELRERFAAEKMPYMPDPKKSVFRLYRDIRFSKNKLPFKTNIGAVIPFRDESNEGVGGYLHLEPGTCFYGCGTYMPDSARVKQLRSAIDNDTKSIRKIIDKLEKTKWPLHGEQLKRAPAGYPEEHPAIDLLRYKQMWVYQNFPDKLATSRDLLDWIVDAAKQTQDFNAFLYDAFRKKIA